MRIFFVFLMLYISFSLVSCNWLKQDSDKNNTEESSEVITGDETKDEPPGDGVPSY